MPCFKIFTNVPRSQVPADFVDKIIPILARTVGKSNDKFICMLNSDCSLHFRGDSSSPSAVATLESIGHIDPARNKDLSKQMSEFIFNTLGIKPEHFFITFYDVQKSNVGIAGTTVQELEP